MEQNRKRLEVQAPEDRWELLGRLLEDRRRVDLGYRHRAPFAEERLPLTPYGNPNKRLIDDIESNRRANRWPSPTLKKLAAAYQVTYESLRAVLDGERDDLAPDAPPGKLAAPGEDMPPVAPERAAAGRRYYDEINERRFDLAARGIIDPTGAQLFPDAPDDAKAWDGLGARLPLGDRVWFIADLRRWEAARTPPNSGTNATGA